MSCRILASRHGPPAVTDAASRIAHSYSVRSPFRSPLQTRKRRAPRMQCKGTETRQGETRRQALGSIVIETNEDLPDPPESDFWEGGAWEVRQVQDSWA